MSIGCLIQWLKVRGVTNQLTGAIPEDKIHRIPLAVDIIEAHKCFIRGNSFFQKLGDRNITRLDSFLPIVDTVGRETPKLESLEQAASFGAEVVSHDRLPLGLPNPTAWEPVTVATSGQRQNRHVGPRSL